MIKEEWRDIPGYEGLYQVSNHGRVRSLDRYVRGKNGSGRFIKGRTLKRFKDKGGYLISGLFQDNKRKHCMVHRLVLTAFDRPPKEGEECNHKDGDKSNNHRPNIEWCTPKQNNWHRDNVLGKHSRGERHGSHVLINQDVRNIRNICKEGKITQRQIAERFNVSVGTISMINTSKIWKHLK